MLTNEYLDALEAQTRSVMESAQRLVEMIGIVRRMVDLDGAAAATPPLPVKTEVKEEEEDWDAEADQPSFYLPRERTVSYTIWSVRCPACGGRPSRCPCS